jgi:hypothetical protein
LYAVEHDLNYRKPTTPSEFADMQDAAFEVATMAVSLNGLVVAHGTTAVAIHAVNDCVRSGTSGRRCSGSGRKQTTRRAVDMLRADPAS